MLKTRPSFILIHLCRERLVSSIQPLPSLQFLLARSLLSTLRPQESRRLIAILILELIHTVDLPALLQSRELGRIPRIPRSDTLAQNHKRITTGLVRIRAACKPPRLLRLGRGAELRHLDVVGCDALLECGAAVGRGEFCGQIFNTVAFAPALSDAAGPEPGGVGDGSDSRGDGGVGRDGDGGGAGVELHGTFGMFPFGQVGCCGVEKSRSQGCDEQKLGDYWCHCYR
jgi:hypothetical protein